MVSDFLYFSDLVRANPKQPDALYYRGLCLYYSGNHPQAILHAQEALRSDPDFALARLVLSSCLLPITDGSSLEIYYEELSY